MALADGPSAPTPDKPKRAPHLGGGGAPSAGVSDLVQWLQPATPTPAAVGPATPQADAPVYDIRSQIMAGLKQDDEVGMYVADPLPKYTNVPAEDTKTLPQYPTGIQVEDAHTDRVQREPRTLRERSLGDAGKVQPMTWEEYNKLSDDQRAAVDFNTMLTKAVKRDTRLQDKYESTVTDKERSQYDLTVEKMFGEGQGSDLYAPETMAVLQQVKFDDRGADLDDFLGLQAAITEKDLKFLKPTETPQAVQLSGLSDIELDRVQLSQDLAESTQDMQASLAAGQDLMASMNQMAKQDRSFFLDQLGGITKEAPPPMAGYGTDETSSYFQQAFDMLAQPSVVGNKDLRDQLLANVYTDSQREDGGFNYNAFLDYADTRSSMATRYDAPLGQADGVKYRTPEEFRKLLGLEGVNSDANL